MDLKFEWENTDVSISEVILSKGTYVAANKEELKKLLETPANTSTWTKSAADKYATAFEALKAVYASEYADQSSIDTVVSSIKNLLNAPELKGDMTPVSYTHLQMQRS